MKNPATYEDANLILKLYDLRREEKLREARRWMAGMPQFTSREHWLEHCAPGTEENAYYRMVTTYWDMVASFVATGVLNAELFYRSNNMELLFMWEKVRLLVPILRQFSSNPLVLRNLEDVSTGFIKWLDEQAPGFHAKWAEGAAKGAAPARK